MQLLVSQTNSAWSHHSYKSVIFMLALIPQLSQRLKSTDWHNVCVFSLLKEEIIITQRSVSEHVVLRISSYQSTGLLQPGGLFRHVWSALEHFYLLLLFKSVSTHASDQSGFMTTMWVRQKPTPACCEAFGAPLESPGSDKDQRAPVPPDYIPPQTP